MGHSPPCMVHVAGTPFSETETNPIGRFHLDSSQESIMMNATLDKSKSQHPFLAGFWLIAAIPISALIAVSLQLLLSINLMNDDGPIGNVILFLGLFAAGYMWARAISSRSGLVNNKLMNIVGGLAFTLLVMGGRLLVVVHDPRNVFGPLFHYKQHLLYGSVFVIWTGLVVGGTGLILGISLKDWKLALKLLGAGLLSGGGTFLAVAFLMDLIGFRVGAPRADERFTMLVVSALGIWSAALVGSAVFGKVFAKANERSSS